MPRTKKSELSINSPSAQAGSPSVKLELLLPFGDHLLLLGSIVNTTALVTAVATLKPESVSDFMLQAKATQKDLLYVQAPAETPEGLVPAERHFLCVLKKTGNVSDYIVAVSFDGAPACAEKISITAVTSNRIAPVEAALKRYSNGLGSLLRNTGHVTPALMGFVRSVLDAKKGQGKVEKPVSSNAFEGDLVIGTGRPVCGWLRNPQAPDATFTVLAYEGDTMVGSGFASQDSVAGMPEAAPARGHYFQLFLLPALYDRKKHNLTFRIKETGAVWTSKEVRFTQAPKAVSAIRPVLGSAETLTMLNTLLADSKDMPESRTFLQTMQQICCSLDAGDVETARGAFSHIPDSLTKTTLVQHKLAECDMLAGEWARASKRFYMIVKKTPKFVWSMLGLVDGLVRQQKFEDAEILFGKLKKFPDVSKAFSERVIYHRLVSTTAEKASQYSDRQRTQLLKQVKQMILLNQNDYLLTHALHTLRHPELKNDSPLDADNPSDLSKLRHHRLLLELACEAAGAKA